MILRNFENAMYQRNQNEFKRQQQHYDSVSAFYFDNASKYLAEYSSKYKYEKHPNGFWFNKTKEGFGEPLGYDMAGGFILKGWLPADSSQVVAFGFKEEPFYIFLEEAFPAIYETWAGMKVGDVYDMLVPADQAFGEEGLQGRIPRHAPLLMQVEVIGQVAEKPLNPNMQGGPGAGGPGGMPRNGMRPPQGGPRR